ncbi:MAG: gamma-glutamyltransferase, partial [Bacteroidetes bacterium]|nr:gamma-glutamyltransferase [Bacteroidota bacterium]
MKIRFLLFITLSLSCNSAYDSDKASSEELIAIPKQGCVVSAHPLASEVGINILKAGGNAYDAAIATQFALAVVYPIAGNIGAGGFAIIRTAEGDLDALDFREKAPKAAHRDMFLDEQGEVIPQLS